MDDVLAVVISIIFLAFGGWIGSYFLAIVY